jgi:hypothetical protein
MVYRTFPVTLSEQSIVKAWFLWRKLRGLDGGALSSDHYKWTEDPPTLLMRYCASLVTTTLKTRALQYAIVWDGTSMAKERKKASTSHPRVGCAVLCSDMLKIDHRTWRLSVFQLILVSHVVDLKLGLCQKYRTFNRPLHSKQVCDSHMWPTLNHFFEVLLLIYTSIPAAIFAV